MKLGKDGVAPTLCRNWRRFRIGENRANSRKSARKLGRENWDSTLNHLFSTLPCGDGSNYAQHMKDARFTIPTPALLARVVDRPVFGRQPRAAS